MHRDFTEAKCRKRPDISRRWKPKPSLFFYPFELYNRKGKKRRLRNGTGGGARAGRDQHATPHSCSRTCICGWAADGGLVWCWPVFRREKLERLPGWGGQNVLHRVEMGGMILICRRIFFLIFFTITKLVFFFLLLDKVYCKTWSIPVLGVMFCFQTDSNTRLGSRCSSWLEEEGRALLVIRVDLHTLTVLNHCTRRYEQW